MNRRTFIKALAAVPVVGVLASKLLAEKPIARCIATPEEAKFIPYKLNVHRVTRDSQWVPSVGDVCRMKVKPKRLVVVTAEHYTGFVRVVDIADANRHAIDPRYVLEDWLMPPTALRLLCPAVVRRAT